VVGSVEAKLPKSGTSILWKACNNILSTKANLSKQGVTQDDKCPICNLETESVGHGLCSY
jgi:hypothetical protein